MTAHPPEDPMPARSSAPANPDAPVGPVDLTAKARDPLPARDTTANLQQRMLAVMHAIGYIPKEGTGPQAQGSYAYAKVEHIKDAVRESCIENGVMVHVSMTERDVEVLTGAEGKRTILVTVAGTMTFVNVDAPTDRETVAIHGQGTDTQDKAVSKATTSAIKYGLLNAFTIPTGADPDAEGHDLPAADRSAPARPPQTRSAPRQRPEGPGPGQYAPPDEPPPYGASSAPTAAPSGDAADQCPKHHRDWKLGTYGYYCSAKDPDGRNGYCDQKPSAAWVAAHER
jgi:ERF superfamily